VLVDSKPRSALYTWNQSHSHPTK